MIVILIFFARVYSELLAYSSYSSKTISLTYKEVTFGGPALYTIYGKAAFISTYPKYPSLPLLPGYFVVFSNYQIYSIASLALAAQTYGAIGVIFVSQSSGWVFNSLPNQSLDTNKVKIVVIGILKTDAESLNELTGNLWLMFKSAMTYSTYPKLQFYINGNYTEDSVFVEALQKLNSNIPLQKRGFAVYANSLYSSDSSVFKSDDCMNYENLYLCMKGTPMVKGKQKVNYTLMILKFLDSSIDIGAFLTSLTNLYTACEFDYSQSCILGKLDSVSLATSEDLKTYYNVFEQTYSYPLYKINSLAIYLPSYLQPTYCSSFTIPPDACSPCSELCSSSSTQNSFCDTKCNTSSCSYDNLKCITNNGCYNFLLGDGICDAFCTNDPDCKQNNPGDICAAGCLYSDMKKGNCPLACSGTCFSSCSITYCSPNCLYDDLYAGKCSSDCTSDCKAKCANNTNICAPGCFYSDMTNGKCPASCTGSCFRNCDSDLYCSPGCSYDSLYSGSCPEVCTDSCLTKCSTHCSSKCNEAYTTKGYCPSDCTDICCNKETSSSSDPNLLPAFIVPPIFGLILIAIILFLCIRRYKRSSVNRLRERRESSNSSPSSSLRILHPIPAEVGNDANRQHNIMPVHQAAAVLPAANPQLANFVFNPQGQNDNELRPLIFNRNVIYVGERACSIDLDDIHYGDGVILTPCGHLFHPRCINEWLQANGRERKCPNCNNSLEGINIRLD